MSTIRVFTDGACENNGRANAKASYAAFFPDHEDWSFAKRVPDEESQTNQRGELLAIHEAVKYVLEKSPPEATHLHIFTDSMYSKNCLTAWLPGWLKNQWKTSSGGSVVHRDLIEETSRNLAKFQAYTITHVAAHTGGKDENSRHNARVDQMAVNVLHPEVKDIKPVSTTEGPLKDLPLTMMGPPMEERQILQWCRSHLEELDTDAVNQALFKAFHQTLKKNGYEIETQRIHKKKVVRLVAASHLITESKSTIQKDE
jgi:ribonuclease HI